MEESTTNSMENEISITITPENDPWVSEDSPPLTHVVGNEYDMTWRSVWIHGQKQSVRLLETSTGIKIEVMNRL